MSEISRKSLELHIDELVLHGFAPRDARAIAEAVQNELSQLLTDQLASANVPELFTQDAEQERVDAGTFNVAQGANGNSIGNEIARTVHRGLTK